MGSVVTKIGITELVMVLALAGIVVTLVLLGNIVIVLPVGSFVVIPDVTPVSVTLIELAVVDGFVNGPETVIILNDDVGEVYDVSVTTLLPLIRVVVRLDVLGGRSIVMTMPFGSVVVVPMPQIVDGVAVAVVLILHGALELLETVGIAEMICVVGVLVFCIVVGKTVDN